MIICIECAARTKDELDNLLKIGGIAITVRQSPLLYQIKSFFTMALKRAGSLQAQPLRRHPRGIMRDQKIQCIQSAPVTQTRMVPGFRECFALSTSRCETVMQPRLPTTHF